MNMKPMLWMAVSLSALVWTGCAEDDESCADPVIRQAQSRLAPELSGTIALVYQGIDIPVQVSISTKENGCGMDFVMSQNVNPACGTTFSGTLEYDSAATPPMWTGELWGDFETDNTRVLIDLQTQKANIVRVNAKIVEASDSLCKDRVLEGDVSPR